MQKQQQDSKQNRRGGILISVLAYVVVISLIMAGVTTLSVSHYTRVRTESDYAGALDAAEAGANYEINKISNNIANVDQQNATGNPGHSYTTSAGSFSVYVTQRNASSETTPWAAPNNLWIYSTGTVNGVSRTVKLAVRGFTGAPSTTYAVFGNQQGIMNATPTFVSGDVGTNGFFTFNNNPAVAGSVIFNGPGSNWQSPPHATYTVQYNTTAVAWPTVETIASQQFTSGGLTWLASHNDNSLASPPILSPNLLINSGTQTFVGKAGGANYYLTNLTCNGSSVVAFNNTNGPITIWIGPSGSSTTFTFAGGTATVKMATDSTKPVKIYSATTNDMALNGNNELDAGIYNVNNSNSGRVIFNGSPNIYGCIISNMFTFNAAPHVNFVSGYFGASSIDHYEAVVPYVEVGGAN